MNDRFDFNKNKIMDRIDEIQYQLEEEQSKEEGERDSKKEFDLMYARFMAGLKLNTGYRMF